MAAPSTVRIMRRQEPTGVRGTRPEDCSWCWGPGSLLGPQLLDGGAHLACGVIDDDDVAVG